VNAESALRLLGSHLSPWFIGLTGEREEADGWSWRLGQEGIIARVVRGKKMTHREGLFNEIAAALQFPSYFGENWDAFQECVSDLGWLPPEPVVLIVTDALAMLDSEPIDALRIFTEILQYAAELQTQPLRFGDAFRFARQPLHIAFQATTEEMPLLRARLGLAGATLGLLDDAAWKRQG
jgi:RNAse (barnase) inhibitor barstar